MNCREFQDRLQDLLDGALPRDERESAEIHRNTCSACEELYAFARGLPGPELVEAPPGLAASILERTSGSACRRAREIVCDFVDGTLEDLDAELLRLHMRGCGDCEALALVLTRLAEDLPAMAELAPGRGFVSAVLAATTAAPAPEPWFEKGSRWAQSWIRLLERPRIAWEVGCAGALAFWLVFGTSVSPLRAAPAQAMTVLSESPVRIEAVTGRAVSFGEQAWQATASRGLDGLDELGSALAARLLRVKPASHELQRHVAETRHAVVELSLSKTGRVLGRVGDEARLIWRQLVPEPEQGNANEDDAKESGS